MRSKLLGAMQAALSALLSSHILASHPDILQSGIMKFASVLHLNYVTRYLLPSLLLLLPYVIVLSE